MKKLILIFTIILLSSCSNNEDIGGSSNSTSINPPTWIQGYWLMEVSAGEVTDLQGYKATKDDFYSTQIGTGNSMKTLISNTLKSGAAAVVEESVSDTEYKLNIKLNGMSFPQYYFKKISSTKIQYFDTTGRGGAIFIKQ